MSRRMLFGLAGLVLLLGACEGSSSAVQEQAGNTVEVVMDDSLKFSPAQVSVKAGDTVRFVFHNRGKTIHDAFLGDERAQADHEKTMGKMGGMRHGDTDEGITIPPGESVEFVHTFTTPGTILIGCHQPGHYGAGMKMAITIT